jgi:cytochrome-b5 reductase
MYQLARHILSNPYDKSRISLIYGSRAENDILLRKELDTLQQQHPDRFSIYYLLDEAPRGWSGGQGLVDKRILEGRIPKAEDSNMVFVCGPDP